MRLSPRFHWMLSGSLLVLLASPIFGQSAPLDDAINKAQRQVTAYLAKLADLHCTELVTQEKVAINGHVEAAERAKYDYLIMMSGSGDEFQLNESRVEASSAHNKQPQLPMLVTNGIATLLLVFHPYYRDGFTFATGNEEMMNGRPAVAVHFTHITGRRTPAALALRGREYPLELQGTAWLDKQSGQVVMAEATLLRDMGDVGLRSLHIHVEYKSAVVGKTEVTLPELAVVDVTTPRQHWRNKHVFDDYRGFSTDAEQNPNVKVHAENVKSDGTAATEPVSSATKEKP
ncbi:MAG: hypothetical protein WBQ94_00150 [Terracidiphilus sp.]